MQPQSRLFLYLLQTTSAGDERSPGFDANDAFVVRAANAKHARTLAAEQAADEGADVWENGNYSTCRRLGEVTAGANRKPRVVLKSFNAG